MAHITLVTSLYRTEAHLPAYIRRADALFEKFAQAGIALQLILVANDATPRERDLLDPFIARHKEHSHIIYVPRESVYASWNRGYQKASAPVMGPWNVDDERSADGLIAAHNAFQSGAELIDAPYYTRHKDSYIPQSVEFKPDCLSPKCGVGPFFLFSKALYQRAGAFNPDFRITGDFEWSKRDAVRAATYTPITQSGGTFHLHDDNLSGGHSSREWVEFNIALLWHGGEKHLRPVDPSLMRELWETWGYTGADLTPQHREWLWGKGAKSRYMRYSRERNAHPLVRRIRLALARRGVLKSIEWEVHHGT